MSLVLYFIAGVLYIIGFTFIIPIFFGIISPIPSMPQINHLLVKKIKEYDPSEGAILDIGSGYGSTVFALSKAFPHRRIIACEISWVPLLFSKSLARLLGHKNITFVHQNGFKYAEQHKEVSSAFFYFPVTRRVEESLKQLRQSYRGILFSNTYSCSFLKAKEIQLAGDIFRSKLLVYDLRHSRSKKGCHSGKKGV